jgi:hypothetical protein
MEINFEAVRVRFPKANGHELDADEVTIPSLLANLIETPLNQRVAGQVLLETDNKIPTWEQIFILTRNGSEKSLRFFFWLCTVVSR